MKMILFGTLSILLAAISAQAKTIASSDTDIKISTVSKVIQMAKVDRGNVTKTVNVVVLDFGKATDVSPTQSIFLTFTAYAEMGNIATSFPIDDVMVFKSAVRKDAGIYEIKALVYRDQVGMKDVTYTLDTTQMFIDEERNRKACGQDFCDGGLNTTIQVKETLSNPNY